MFDSKHYIPIMKWKRAEQGALKSLADKHKSFVTPLVQFVMPKPKPDEGLEDIITKFEQQAEQIPDKIIEVWGKTPIFIDVSLLFTTPLKAESLFSITKKGAELGGIFIPVIHLHDEQAIISAAFSIARETGQGVCLRLVCADLDNLDKLPHDITELLQDNELTFDKMDLLVDIKETEVDTKKCLQYWNLSQQIPNLKKWRTFIFASGSFPENLSECKLDEENLLPRIDWLNWKSCLAIKSLVRTPSFADYAIQHPIYKEVSQFFHPTTSIKYTLEDNWLIMKGKKQKYELYLASAATLLQDDRFYGEDFSAGDKYISEKARHFENYIKNPGLQGTGSTETWLRAGINHHLTLTAHQVANLT